MSELGQVLWAAGPAPRDARWASLLAEPTRRVSELVKDELPDEPGVYLWRHDGRPVYVGQSGRLRNRIWTHHLGRGASLGSSSLRRNVAELLLGIPTSDTVRGRRRLAADDVDVVSTWLRSCELSWQVTASAVDAIALERGLRAAWWSPLNRV